MSKNDVTGDKIQAKGVLSEQGRDNYDRIFSKKKGCPNCGSIESHACPGIPPTPVTDEEKIRLSEVLDKVKGRQL